MARTNKRRGENGKDGKVQVTNWWWQPWQKARRDRPNQCELSATNPMQSNQNCLKPWTSIGPGSAFNATHLRQPPFKWPLGRCPLHQVCLARPAAHVCILPLPEGEARPSNVRMLSRCGDGEDGDRRRACGVGGERGQRVVSAAAARVCQWYCQQQM